MHVEKGLSHKTSRMIQNPPIQTERKSSSLRQPQRYLSLLSTDGKILAKILLNRLNAHLDKAGLIPESQCGFRKDRGTIDMTFTARQL